MRKAWGKRGRPNPLFFIKDGGFGGDGTSPPILPSRPCDEDAAQALAAAVAESDADPRTVPHEDVRAWLLRLANGEFDAPPPEPR